MHFKYPSHWYPQDEIVDSGGLDDVLVPLGDKVAHQ